jgi:GGDEF domain-containing protein
VLLNLQRLNELNNRIVKVDVPVRESAERMLDALFAQETYEKRYLVLRGEDTRLLFMKRSREFKDRLLALQALSGHGSILLENIGALHTRYVDLFRREARFVKAGDLPAAAAVSSGELRNVFEKLLTALRSLSAEAKLSQDGTMKKISEIGKSAFYTTSMICILSIVLGALAGLVVTQYIASSIQKLKDATAHIAEGNFQYDPRITTQDEIGALAGSFVAMGKRLKMLEEMYLDASPLTRLPGGIAIENILKRRIESRMPIAFCVIDLDNFKAFNDHYGYAHGNLVIRETARIIESVVKEKGAPDDFVGHIGGDDFVAITTPDYMREISSGIIKNFDQRILQFYDQKDRTSGFILGKNRQGQEMQFPLMTISIAIVTNEQHAFKDPIQVSEIAAELKDYAKTITSSVYVVDKRRAT